MNSRYASAFIYAVLELIKAMGAFWKGKRGGATRITGEKLVHAYECQAKDKAAALHVFVKSGYIVVSSHMMPT